MRNKLGVSLMAIGSVLIIVALCLLLYNERQQLQAAQSTREAIPKVVEAIQEKKEEIKQTEQATIIDPLPVYSEASPEPEKMMPVVEIDGYGYVGFLSIPALELELPVMAEWSYPKLYRAPCRYAGETYSDDLVIMAHDYKQHFGRIPELQPGDTLTFTDMDAVTVEYEVVAKDVLQPSDVEEMTAGNYDLMLFTCNYTGQSRITVCCDRKTE